MFGRILLDNDYFLVTAGLLGSIKSTLKSRGLTLKATREERTKLLDVLDELKRRGYSVEPDSKEFEEILDGFSEALFGRGGYRWQAYFLVTTCENIVSDVVGESDNSNTDVEKVDSGVTSPLDWNIVSDFFEVDWRPAVITRSEEAVEGWFSPEAGKPFRPLALGDILKNGSVMSKADFQEAFPDEIAGADKITSNIDLSNTVPFDWDDVSEFYNWEGRPAVLVRPDTDSLSGFFIRASAEPGTWEAASPAEIVNSGRELSKDDFQEAFAEKLAGVEKVDSSVTLPFDWNDVSAFFDWEGRPAVEVMPSDPSSDVYLEGWFSAAPKEEWLRASPLEIRESGRELSKSDFQDTFTDFNITINKN